MAEQEYIGDVIHYFSRIGVAVLALRDDLAVGDRVEFVRNDDVLFAQDVFSLEIDHRPIERARRGEDVALAVAQKVKPGTAVYKLHALPEQKGLLRRVLGI